MMLTRHSSAKNLYDSMEVTEILHTKKDTAGAVPFDVEIWN